MDTKERLKHASEVLGWLAEGRTVQGRCEIVGSDWQQVAENFDADFLVARVMDGDIIYRIKPEPVEFEAEVGVWSGRSVILARDLQPGQRVKVTLLEP